MIPSGWTEVRLGALGPFTKGKGIKKDQVVSDGLPCVRYGQIYTDHNSWIRNFTAFISSETARDSRRLVAGELLFTGSGETAAEIGKCVAYLGNEEAYAGGDILILTPSGVNSKFLGYALNAPQIVQQKMQCAQGNAVVHISASSLASLRVVLPPIPEQEAIAEVLSDVDILIESLDALIAKKRDMKQAAMQQLLTGRTRLPGFDKPWLDESLGSLLKYEQPTKYLVNNSDYLENGNVPVLTAGKSFLLGFTNEEEGVYDSGPTILFDDFTTAVQWVDFPFKVKSSACKMLTPRSESVDLRFVYEQLREIRFEPTDHKRHWISMFASMTIRIPTSEEQRAISEVLSEMADEIDVLVARREKAELVKQGLMQELLSGRVRLV